MSRRSLYRQSRHVTQSAFSYDIEDRVVHWTKEWTSIAAGPGAVANTGSAAPQNSGTVGTPNRSTGTPIPGLGDSSSALNVDSPGINGNARQENAGVQEPTLGFTVKMWVATTDDSSAVDITVKDCDEDDLLDVSQLNPRKQDAVIEETKAADSLTAADIRGAVGGEAIPGIVAANFGATNDEQAEEATEIKANGVDSQQPNVDTAAPTAASISKPTANETPQSDPPVGGEQNDGDVDMDETSKGNAQSVPESAQGTTLDSSAETNGSKEDIPAAPESIDEPREKTEVQDPVNNLQQNDVPLVTTNLNETSSTSVVDSEQPSSGTAPNPAEVNSESITVSVDSAVVPSTEEVLAPVLGQNPNPSSSGDGEDVTMNEAPPS
ncbi:hypothetical protein AWJ20_1567 [Sugiyamaella lignohabitans]|uniref:Uncharacterized protein n=1 Tax=Sugiyamaella lignohabitans TaxID=796027 RepID=A0A161HXJ2_9ASCO|nr:uncharacterized protein AWJ20_1567 [Sugiyamaella lignohabitans]ANB13283.1 hypothetical protein AWJ20_1567 [Sugiyamaella lignohabitans]